MEKFNRAILISISLVIFLSIMDIQGFAMWQTLGGFGSEAYTKAEAGYMKLFWTFAYGLIVVLCLGYYFFYKKDLSEITAIAMSFLILLWFGLEDLLYYLFQGKPIDTVLPWLNNHFVMGRFARFIGECNVTSKSLILGVILGGIIIYFLIRFLKKEKW